MMFTILRNMYILTKWPDDIATVAFNSSLTLSRSLRVVVVHLTHSRTPCQHVKKEDTASDMLLDLSGLTREERVMVQASIGNERDFDRVAEALIIQNPRIHLQESQRWAKDGFKRLDNHNARWFRGKGKHTGSGKSGASTHHANLPSVADYDSYHEEDMDESANAYEAHNDPVDPGNDDGEEALDHDDDEENHTLSYDALDDVTVFDAAELDAIALVADTWNDNLDPEVSAQFVHTQTSRTHMFLLHSVSAHIRTSWCVCTHTHGSRLMEKVFVACLCLISPSRLLYSHVSPVLAVPARTLRDHSWQRRHWLRHPHDLAVLSRLKIAGHAPLRTCIAKFGYLAESDANTSYQPKKLDKNTSVDDDTMLINDPNHNFSDFSKTTKENTGQFVGPTVFESPVSARFLWLFCSSNRKQRKPAIGKPLLDKVKQKKEKVLRSMLQNRCQRKIDGTVLVWVWRVSEN